MESKDDLPKLKQNKQHPQLNTLTQKPSEKIPFKSKSIVKTAGNKPSKETSKPQKIGTNKKTSKPQKIGINKKTSKPPNPKTVTEKIDRPCYIPLDISQLLLQLFVLSPNIESSKEYMLGYIEERLKKEAERFVESNKQLFEVYKRSLELNKMLFQEKMTELIVEDISTINNMLTKPYPSLESSKIELLEFIEYAEKAGKSLRDHNLRLFELNEYLLESNRMILNTLKSKFNTTEDKLSVDDIKYSNELIETLADANHKHVLIRSDEDEGYSPEPTPLSVKNNFKTKS